MERYETAAIELVDLDEDVITASGTNSTTSRTATDCTYNHSEEAWIVTFSDGTTENYPYYHGVDGHGRPDYDVCS